MISNMVRILRDAFVSVIKKFDVNWHWFFPDKFSYKCKKNSEE